MITRAQMPRQLRNRGGMTVKTVRQKYGLGSLIKKTIRKLIPNELADIAVKAAPFVAPFNPGAAALMRGVGRFDQRGSISDALKQGAATYAFGKGVGKLGGAQTGEGFLGGQKFSMEGFREGPLGTMFPKTTTTDVTTLPKPKPVVPEKETGIIRAITDKTIAKIPGATKLLPKSVMDQLVVGGITSGASALYSYFKGDFRPQEEGETMEEYLAARKESVGKQMRTFMDNYYRFDPEYSAMSDAERDAFVARYNMKKGGRVGLQEGGLPTVESLGGLPNTKGGRIVYDLGNGSYIYESPIGFEIVENGVYTSIGSKDSYSSLDDLLDSGTVMRRADDPIRIAKEAEFQKFLDDPREVRDRSMQATIEDIDAAATTPTPTGIQTIPSDKKVFNVMLDEKGNVADDQSLTQLFRETGTAPRVGIGGPVPIRSVSDVFRLAGITGEDGISMRTDYGDSRTLPSGGVANTLPSITGERSLRENVAINEARRRRNQELLDVAKSRLPGIMPGKTILPSSNAGIRGSFAQPVTLDGQQFTNEADAIKALGIERYNQLMAKGGSAKKIPIRTNSEGVKELDYRKTGGFVPIGVKEKADDVPAMLSLNEFVFTADAVRGAGDGSIKKGAQRMYDTMKKLESKVV
tara:strand:- start:1372 stop:3279 length:1908 start_codon:yes stop_codon:yes gene_type:complete